MRLLLTLDAQNYTETMPVSEKTTVRALVVRGGRIAMQRSRKGEYKIPGGTVEQGEDPLDTLMRETREEIGLLIKPETITELGKMVELREDVFCKGQKYVCHTYFYQCQVEPEQQATNLTEGEREKGYEPVWELPEVIVRENRRIQAGRSWRGRDTEFLALVLSGKVKIEGL